MTAAALTALPASVDATVAGLRAQNYLADRPLATLVHLGLRLQRPLLLEGEPGTGKTELARALAAMLHRPLVRLQCHEGLDFAGAVAEWSYGRQLLAVQLAGSGANRHSGRPRVRPAGGPTVPASRRSGADGIGPHGARDALAAELFSRDYLQPRALLRALDSGQPAAPVLLIDELDRADAGFEALLLEVLAEHQVTIPELGTVRAEHPPIVVVTSNRTREVADAIRRRCLYQWLDFPDAGREREILERHVPGMRRGLAQALVAFVQRLRRVGLRQPPGLAQSVAWAQALQALDATELTPEHVRDTLGALLRAREDLVRLQGDVVSAAMAGGLVSASGAATVAARRRAPPSSSVAGPLAPGRLADNVMHFARLLRAAGLAVAGDRIQLALRALPLAQLDRRDDVAATLAACFVARREQRPLFDEAFAMFWRDPAWLTAMPGGDEASAEGGAAAERDSASRRLTAAWLAQAPALTPAAQEGDDEDAAGTLGLQERLRRMDFAEMSADEWRAAQAQLLRMRQLTEWLPTRRLARAHRPGRPDWRATLAAMARRGGEADGLRWRRPRRVPAPVVVLADISGSMRRYARMLLHFAHALGRSGVPVESFVFGTRLTRITRQLAQRDPDAAVQGVVQAVPDWSGGTRIADSLHRFNRQWSRRVLGGRVTVLLITDGLEPGDPDALAFETERLRKQCRRLVWLNPLLRFDGFEPRARGIRAMLPHVDRFVPAHNLVSLAALVDGLMDAGRPAPLRSRSPVSAQDSAR